MNTFDQNSFNTYDGPAKIAASGWLVSRGWEVQENPNIYGIDLLAARSDRAPQNLEVQVRKNWSWGKWPYPDHEIHGRKEGLCESGNYGITFRSDYGAAVISALTGEHTTYYKILGRGEPEKVMAFKEFVYVQFNK